MMTRLSIAVTSLPFLLMPHIASAQNSDVSKSTCYEVIPARANMQPRTSMLVDKCDGRTWLLTKSRSGTGYRWVRIAADESAPPAAGAARAAASPGDSRNCFTFNNRRFCE